MVYFDNSMEKLLPAIAKRIYNPIMAMWFSAMFTFQLDNTKRLTLLAPHCSNGSCRYVWALSKNFGYFTVFNYKQKL